MASAALAAMPFFILPSIGLKRTLVFETISCRIRITLINVIFVPERHRDYDNGRSNRPDKWEMLLG